MRPDNTVAVYLAGPWANRDSVRIARERFRSVGIQVNSQWLDVPIIEGAGNDAASQASAGYNMADEAHRDLDDIDHSDLMVVMNLSKSEGKAVETGIALAKEMQVIVVGERSNVFHYLPQVIVVETVEEAIAKIREIYPERFSVAA
jgi:nucleoside 2-deoxyribosyltransferase